MHEPSGARVVARWPGVRTGRAAQPRPLAQARTPVLTFATLGPVSPATIDALAAFSTEGEDMEDEPVEDQGDDGPSIVSTTWE